MDSPPVRNRLNLVQITNMVLTLYGWTYVLWYREKGEGLTLMTGTSATFILSSVRKSTQVVVATFLRQDSPQRQGRLPKDRIIN